MCSVQFDEFERMVRYGLKLRRGKLPEETLAGLWKHIDENENGFICAGEFARFMRQAAEGPNARVQLEKSANNQLQTKMREDHIFAVRRHAPRPRRRARVPPRAPLDDASHAARRTRLAGAQEGGALGEEGSRLGL